MKLGLIGEEKGRFLNDKVISHFHEKPRHRRSELLYRFAAAIVSKIWNGTSMRFVFPFTRKRRQVTLLADVAAFASKMTAPIYPSNCRIESRSLI